MWGDGGHVAGLGFLDSHGNKYYYGSNFKGEVEYEKSVSHFYDSERMIGAFGRTINRDGDDILV